MYLLWHIVNLVLIIGINAMTLTVLGTKIEKEEVPRWFLVLLVCLITLWALSGIAFMVFVRYI